MTVLDRSDLSVDRWERQMALAGVIARISGSQVTFGNQVEVLEGHQFFDRFNKAVVDAAGHVGFCAYEHYSDSTGLAMARAMGKAVEQGRRALVVVDGHGGNNHPHTALTFTASRHTRAPVRQMLAGGIDVRVFHPTWLPHTFGRRGASYQSLPIRPLVQDGGPRSVGRLSQRRTGAMSSPFHQHRKIGVISDVLDAVGPKAIGVVAGIQVMDSVRVGRTVRDRATGRSVDLPPTHDTALWIQGPAVNFVNLALLDLARKAERVCLGPRQQLTWPTEATDTDRRFQQQLQAVNALSSSPPHQPQWGGVQVAMSEPTFTSSKGAVAYLTSLALLRFARERVRIVTPCLNLPVEVLSEFVRTTARGVRIEIVTNGALSEPLVRRAAVAQYDTLMKSGVRIYELADGELHDKFVDVDGLVVVGGSQNWNWRSMTEDHEMAAYLYDNDVIGTQNRRYEQLRDTRCAEVTVGQLPEARRQVGLDRRMAPFITSGLSLVN